MVMEDDDDRGGINWRTISIFGVLLLAGIGGALWLVPQFMPDEQGELVIIEAPQGDFKAKPIDAGGKKITNQDSAVMEMLGDLAPGKEAVETLVPPSDDPELPAVKLTPEPKDDAADVKTAKSDNTDSTESGNAAPANATDNAKAEVKAETAKPKAAKIVATPKTPEKTAPEPAATVKKKKIVVDGNEPAYMVQLAAFRDANTAAEQAGLLSNKHQSRLQGVSMGTMRIDTGDNGIFWRIVSEPLPRAAADKVCASLKRAGQDCILRKFISPAQ